MTPVFLSDLDDTLFQTREKCPRLASDLKVMSTLADGRPSGFATIRQQWLLSWMSLGRLIPVTARSTSVMARVDIPQAPAICANGGCIIQPDGTVDRLWHDRLVGQAHGDHAVQDVYHALTASLDPNAFRHWIVSENDLPLYIVIKSNTNSVADLAALADRHLESLPANWRRHSNGNNLAYLPGWLNKRHAVAYLIDRIRDDAPDTPIIGIGDSLSDAGFMDLCDYALAPTASQLWQSVVTTSDWAR